MDAQTLVPAIFAILAFITVVGLGLPWLEPDIFKSRLKVINAKRSELSQQRRQRLDVQKPSSGASSRTATISCAPCSRSSTSRTSPSRPT